LLNQTNQTSLNGGLGKMFLAPWQLFFETLPRGTGAPSQKKCHGVLKELFIRGRFARVGLFKFIL